MDTIAYGRYRSSRRGSVAVAGTVPGLACIGRSSLRWTDNYFSIGCRALFPVPPGRTIRHCDERAARRLFRIPCARYLSKLQVGTRRRGPMRRHVPMEASMSKITVRGLWIVGFTLSLAVPLSALAEAQPGPQQEDSQGRSQLPMKVGDSIHFREIGPAISGGRVTAVVGVAGNPQIYYVGAADGGIFRTENGGMTWKALFQHQPVASIGALAVDPRNPAVIWAGTGESSVRNDVSYGDGIYKSTDAGLHWKHLGLERTFQISRIAVDPLNPDTVLVAAMGSPWEDNPERGVYRTTDGGATWQKVLYAGPGVAIGDLAMDPRNPDIVFAATYRYRRTPWGFSGGGPEDAIYKSMDGGVTWKRLSGNGLPSKPVTRIGLAIAPSEPNIVYAVMG